MSSSESSMLIAEGNLSQEALQDRVVLITGAGTRLSDPKQPEPVMLQR